VPNPLVRAFIPHYRVEKRLMVSISLFGIYYLLVFIWLKRFEEQEQND